MSAPPPTPLRAEKQAKAKVRALEEQAERTADVRAVASSTGARMAPSEASYEGYGRRMAEHLKTMNGGAFHGAFMRGLSMPAIGNPDAPAAGSKFSSNVPEKAAATPAILKKGGKAKKGGIGAGIGAGPLKLEISHMEEDKGLEGGRIVGGAMTGRYEGEGVKPDRRKARGALLKRVMAEHGCSMAEASKMIKDKGMTY
jgi:hypothetical protein